MKQIVRILAQLRPNQLGWVALVLPFSIALVAIGFFYWVVVSLRMDEALNESQRLTRLTALNVQQVVEESPSESAARATLEKDLAFFEKASPGFLEGEIVFVSERPIASDPHSPLESSKTVGLADANGTRVLHISRAIRDSSDRPFASVILSFDLNRVQSQLLPIRQAALFATLIALVLSYIISRLAVLLRSRSIAAIAERQRAADLMRDARDSANRARVAETELLAIAAHDLKNPLAAIRGFSQMIEMRLREGEIHQPREWAERIAETTNSLLHIVENLLARASIGQDGFRLQTEVFDLRELLNKTCQLNSLAATRKGIAMAITAPVAVSVKGDRVRLCEALDNLVNNAVKYSPIGSTIYLSAELLGDKVRLSVADEGAGLTPEDLKLVFRQFQRLSAKPTGGESSIGLGLSICKTIIEAHGGQVQCCNRPEGGAEFSVILPRWEGSLSQLEPAVEATALAS